MKILNLLGLATSIFSRLISFKQKKRSSRKIAIFTEGQTEQLFVEGLLLRIAGQKQLHIEKHRAFGGRKFPRISFVLGGQPQSSRHHYFALIWDCGSDGRVASDIRDQYPTLVASGYTSIVAVRDVRPEFTFNEIPRLRSGFEKSVPLSPIVPTLALAVMEMEAWFIGEHSHFARVDPLLTVGHIQASVGIDVSRENLEAIPEPAALMSQIYSLAGHSYSKSRTDVERTVGLLNFDWLIANLSARAPNFRPLLTALDAFFS